jgi:hypothetical protein
MYNKAEQYLMQSNMVGNFNPNKYALLLKQDIDAKLKYNLWKFREEKSGDFKSTYAMCNHIMTLVEKSINEI